MQFQNITHNGNNLILKQTLPYIRVIYPDDNLVDDIGAENCVPVGCTIQTDTSILGKTIYSREFFVAYGASCQPGNWQNYGCYRYKEIMEFWDVNAGGSGTKARFRPVLQAWGPGLSNVTLSIFGTYYPYWRIDTNMPTGSNNEYFREKAAPSCSTTWNDFVNEVTLSPACTNGEIWRTYDYDVGYSKSIGVDPITASPQITVLRYNNGQDDPTNVNPFCCPSQWDNNELIYVQNQVLWFTASEQQSTTNCYPGSSCKIQSGWILSGNPPW
jgi:hypothetical protein